MASFKPRRVVGGGCGWLGIAIIELPQPSQAGTWAELGNNQNNNDINNNINHCHAIWNHLVLSKQVLLSTVN